MDTMFMKQNSKAPKLHALILKLTNKLDLKEYSGPIFCIDINTHSDRK